MTNKYTPGQIESALNVEVCGEPMRNVMCELLATLFKEAEGFSGKRPLGMSDWLTDFGPAVAVLEPSIGEYILDDGNDPTSAYFEVNDWKLFDETIEEILRYVFKTE